MDIKVIIKCFFIISCVVTSVAEDSSHESELQLLKAQVEMLKSTVMKLVKERDSTSLYFDCYRTENLGTVGTITFNGCSVDTTTIDPWMGMFTIQTPGIYRFTFMGRVHTPYGESAAEVDLEVDGEVVASARVYSFDEEFDVISMNTLQELRNGQNISITWSGNGGASLDGGGHHVHFTGEYVASSELAPPQCEYTGQTFEYPGSCRMYYLCLADGTIELNDCCPGVFNPIEETCISEDAAEYLCNEEDTC